MLWTHLSSMVLSFEKETEVELHVPCSYDFEVAAHKYLASLESGAIPLNLQFSGTAFIERDGTVMPEFVPWSCEARYALPVAVWRDAVDASFPTRRGFASIASCSTNCGATKSIRAYRRGTPQCSA